MKKGLIIIGAIVLLAVVFLMPKYNGMVSLDEKVKSSWAQVEASYQRRSDLIPQLVNTVKGQADYEKSTLNEVIQARASATQIKIDPNNITPEALEQFNQAQNNVNSSLSRLLVTVEKYPELKANEGFMNLQAQLEGTENRINKARSDFNTTSQEYNQYVRSTPNNIVAALFGFHQKPYFQAKQGADVAPNVEFNFDKK